MMTAMPAPGPEPISLSFASDRALRVAFGGTHDVAAHRQVQRLLARLDRERIDGVDDLSPAHATILVRFNPLRIAPAAIESALRRLLVDLDDEPLAAPRRVEIPVRYGGEEGPDLPDVARHAGLTPEGVVALHSGTRYEVLFLGFTPGFAYLGTVPEPIACARLDEPRRSVPAGSVGIAGAQTGVYPAATPGGWRLIGRTPLSMFAADRTPMSLLLPGDEVRFVPLAGGVAAREGA
jgi:KipI family sensor histidine kinase inhibitor